MALKSNSISVVYRESKSCKSCRFYRVFKFLISHPALIRVSESDQMIIGEKQNMDMSVEARSSSQARLSIPDKDGLPGMIFSQLLCICIWILEGTEWVRRDWRSPRQDTGG